MTQTKEKRINDPFNKNATELCGPGCACGKEIQGGRWKVVVMLIVVAAVAIALIYRKMF